MLICCGTNGSERGRRVQHRTYPGGVLSEDNRAIETFRHLDRAARICMRLLGKDYVGKDELLDGQDGVVDVSNEKEREGRVRHKGTCQ